MGVWAGHPKQFPRPFLLQQEGEIMARRNVNQRTLKDRWGCPTCRRSNGSPKFSYPNKSIAKKAKRRHHGEKYFAVYECPSHSGTFHLGHLPGPVRRGQMTRAEMYGRG